MRRHSARARQILPNSVGKRTSGAGLSLQNEAAPSPIPWEEVKTVTDILYLAATATPKPPKAGFLVTADSSGFALIISAIVVLLVYVMINRAKQGLALPEIRKIRGMDAFDEAVGRATEMGKPVHMTNYGEILGSDDTFAYWSYLAHVARVCASYDTRLIISDANYLVNAVNQEVVKQAYLEAGKPDAYNSDDVRFISGSQFAWAMGVAGLLSRERPAAQFLIGNFYAEALILAEAGSSIGAIQVASTSNSAQTPFFVAACDYTLIGEELYAGAAYLSKDPVITGTVVSQDILRFVLYALVIGGAVWETLSPKTNALKTLLRF